MIFLFIFTIRSLIISWCLSYYISASYSHILPPFLVYLGFMLIMPLGVYILLGSAYQRGNFIFFFIGLSPRGCTPIA